MTLLISTTLLVASPAAAQDCSIDEDDWGDVQRFRDRMEKHGLGSLPRLVLHQAAASTVNPTIVHLLLEAGADPNARDGSGQTPLHAGATNSNLTVMARLLSGCPSRRQV